MSLKRYFLIIGAFVLTFVGYFYFSKQKGLSNLPALVADNPNMENEGGLEDASHPLSIEALRGGDYQGSVIVIEQTLEGGSNYQTYIASYKSEDLKIYALLTVPNGTLPVDGWPVIIFNHGYIPPNQYRTTERYVSYVDGFARNGYIVFKPDYRGHGDSEGGAVGAYGSSAYTVDVLNALASIKRLKDPSKVDSQKLIADSERIGMWGHSMGGHITLRSMVVSKDVRAGVIWAGVVGSYPDLVERWRRRITATPQPTSTTGRGRWRQELIERYGEPSQNPDFWNSISANAFLQDISGPLQLHHGTADSSVPLIFSQDLAQQMKDVGRQVELYVYEGDDHNLSKNFSLAMRRSIEFFDKYLKATVK